MKIGPSDEPSVRKPLRLWPGVVFLVLQWLAWYVVPAIVPDWAFYSVMVGLAFGLAILVWWLAFSRAPWLERVGAILLMVVAVFAAYRIVHPSIAGGMTGMMLPIFSIPILSLALVAWAAVSQRLSALPRLASLVAAVVLACGVFALFRTGGMDGDGKSDLHWRWTKTPEQQLLAKAAEEPAPATSPSTAGTPSPTPTAEPTPTPGNPSPTPAGDAAVVPASSSMGPKTGSDWPGFRGPNRDSIIRGVKIKTDWSASPPVEVWRAPVGPGWSSFAVLGDRVYTQEQRGEDEIVACYNLSTGKPVWRHRDAARFWESNAGAGPRGTPTLSRGRVYTLGATGILNVLDAGTGAVAWSRNAASDTDTKVPAWGIASSPLVLGDMVIVATAGTLIAYDLTTGKQRWIGPTGQSGYSSPQLATIDGVQQVLLLSGAGAVSVSPNDGKQLWEHKWPGDGIVQPAVTAEGDVLIGAGSGMGGGVGMQRFSVGHGAGGWTVAEKWTSIGLKPYYNDFVVHKGHAFGFDGSILACIDLADGKRKWKGGRYGHGQLLLLPDQDLLLVLSEEGEVVLVSAKSDQFSELAKFSALEGKTWNHPVVVGDLLLARNSEQMAAFRLPVAGR